MSRKIFTILCLAFLLVSCSSAPAPTVTTTSQAAVTFTPASTDTPAPTATRAATATPAIDVLRESFATCPGFEVLCTNPHAFGLSGAELIKWQQLRAQKDAEYTKAWGEVINKDTAWQAEYRKFLGENPPIGTFESLTLEQQLNVIAVYMRVQNANGFMPFNISTDLINATIDDPGKLITYRVNGHLIGFEHSPASFTQEEYDAMINDPGFQVISFGQQIALPWVVHTNDLGVFAKDIIGPVFVPGKAGNEALYLFVYVRDQNNIPYPAFVEIPFAQQTLDKGGYFEHGDSPYSRIEPGNVLEKTVPVKVAYWNGKSWDTTSINSSNVAQFWLALLQARDGEYFIVLSGESNYPYFFGGVKCVTTIVTILPSY